MSSASRNPGRQNIANERRKQGPEVKNRTSGRSRKAPQSAPSPPVDGFFQEPEVFRALKGKILPRVLKAKLPGEPIRVWVPGASTGEEVYSIAICLLEALADRSLSTPIRLFGTDIVERAIQIARAGIYPANALFGVSEDHLRRFFVKEEGNYRVTRVVREACIFACHDLTNDPPFSRLDLIRCRERLDDLEPVLERQVLSTFHYALRDTGFLLLGQSGTPSACPGLFKMVDRKNKFFVKRAGVTRAANVTQRPHDLSRQGPDVSGDESWVTLTVRRRNAVEDSETRWLKDQLAHAKQHVEAITQQYETINEELKSANEEAVSSMEELQSVNEELESAKDELQSTNEELVVLNEQVGKRNVELGKLSDDVNNILAGVNIPIVMLGADRRIRRATPNAERLLHVQAADADAGRPITDIRMGFGIADLDGLISAVLNERRELEREVRGEDGRWYSLRLRPYWTGARKIDGVLLTLLDIHALKENQEALRREERFLSAVLDAAGKSLLVLVLDSEGRILHFNQACRELSGYSLEEARGRRPWEFLLPPEEAGALKGVFERVTSGAYQQQENHWITKDGRRRLIAWNNGSIDDAGQTRYIIRSGIDVTERQQARDQARHSEATVRALLETAAQAIIGINAAGSVVLANAAAETIFGYTREEMLDEPVEKLLPPGLGPQHFRDRAAFLKQPQHGPNGKDLHLAGLRKDRTEFLVEVSLSQVVTAEGSLTVAFITDITERKRNEEILRQSEASARASQQQLRELTADLLEAQEEERRRVSRELHDDLNQKLAMLAVELGSIEAKIPESDCAIRAQLQCVEKRLNGLSDDVRRTAYRLHPSVLEHLGLVEALQTYCTEFSGQEGIKVDFRLRHVPDTIPKGTALCLYRVAQEALRNIAKHSGASRASVTLAGTRAGATLTVVDQGRGFDAAAVEGKRGLGVVSMKERVTAAGGLLTIEARPGAGTRVRVQIPLDGESQ
jgi:PAS domain S-box-containing protein